MARRLVSRLLVVAPPRRDALDDEEALTRLHIPESPRLTRQGLRGVHVLEAPLEPELLRTELANLLRALPERVSRREVAPQRLRVEKRDEREDDQREPAEQEAAARDAFLRASCHLGRVFE